MDYKYTSMHYTLTWVKAAGSSCSRSPPLPATKGSTHRDSASNTFILRLIDYCWLNTNHSLSWREQREPTNSESRAEGSLFFLVGAISHQTSTLLTICWAKYNVSISNPLSASGEKIVNSFSYPDWLPVWILRRWQQAGHEKSWRPSCQCAQSCLPARRAGCGCVVRCRAPQQCRLPSLEWFPVMSTTSCQRLSQVLTSRLN